jgi:hypothetical protein
MFQSVLRRLSAKPAGRGRLLAWALALMLAAMLSVGSAGRASAASFVDANLPDVPADKKVVIAHPQPVQLLFQFHTKGAPNLQATKLVKQTVVDAVKASGLFSAVSEDPAPNGAVLNVVIDNVVDPAEMKAATGSGVVTGATFFIAGSTVRDHYVSTLDYIGGPTAAKITRTASHSILMQMGLINSAPANAVKVEGGVKGAVLTMARQIVANPLNALASDPGFAPAADGAPATTATPPAAATPPADPAAPAPPAAAPGAPPAAIPATPAAQPTVQP